MAFAGLNRFLVASVLVLGTLTVGVLATSPAPAAGASTVGPDWTSLSLTDRQGAVSAYDSVRDQVVLFGGNEVIPGPTLGDTWTSDGTAWTQQHPTTSPPARAEAAMAFDAATGTTVLFGGTVNGEPSAIGDTWTWDGTDWTEQFPAKSPPARFASSMVYDAATGTVVLFGGGAAGGDNLGDTWTWDGTNWTQVDDAGDAGCTTSCTDSPPARTAPSMAYDAATGKVVLFGGDVAGGSGALYDTWTWDGTNWTEQSPITSPPARMYAAMTYDEATSTVVLFGGFVPNGGVGNYLDDTWTWDGTNWTQVDDAGDAGCTTSCTDSPPARRLATMTYDAATSDVVLFGGAEPQPDGGFELDGDSWTWDGTNWTEQSPGDPSAREYGSMAYDAATSSAVLFGGYNGQGTDGDTWTWDGSSWTPQSPATSPLTREQASMAYDAATSDVVLFGGLGTEPQPLAYSVLEGDTWTWDGANWTEHSPVTSPPARLGASMVYDAATGNMVLFGGELSAAVSCPPIGPPCTPTPPTLDNNTWTWDGTTWTEQSPTISPPARYLASMAYDAATGNVVLFGGVGTSGDLSDTWTWDGTTWTEQNPAPSPPARDSAAMDFDPATNAVVLFGGQGPSGDNGIYLGDTWTWDGSTWTEQSPATSPSARYGANMVFDSSGNEILFGGFAEDPGPDGSTWRLTDSLNPQTITFNAPASGLVGGSATLSATGGASGNPVVFSVDSTSGAGVCSVAGSTVTYLAQGTCVLDANQAGNAGYDAAPRVTHSVAVGPKLSGNVLHGYWLVGSDGGIFSFGSALFHGSTGNLKLNRPVVGITPTTDEGGYWLVASDGGIFSFGDTQFYGSIPGLGLAPAGSTGPGRHLNAPIVGMVPSFDGGGYFLVGADGGVFAFGDATFEGSCPGIGGCAGAAVAVMPDASGKGYWLVTQTGHVYSFGDAQYYGAPGPQLVPVTAAVRTPDGKGYWILFSNGMVTTYGDAQYYGAPAGGTVGSDPATAIFASADGAGYWVATANGTVYNYGDAPTDGGMNGTKLNGAIIAGTGF
jgi:hypothetical protein